MIDKGYVNLFCAEIDISTITESNLRCCREMKRKWRMWR